MARRARLLLPWDTHLKVFDPILPGVKVLDLSRHGLADLPGPIASHVVQTIPDTETHRFVRILGAAKKRALPQAFGASGGGIHILGVVALVFLSTSQPEPPSDQTQITIPDFLQGS